MVQAYTTLENSFPKALGMPEPCLNLAKTKQCLWANLTMSNETVAKVWSM